LNSRKFDPELESKSVSFLNSIILFGIVNNLSPYQLMHWSRLQVWTSSTGLKNCFHSYSSCKASDL